MSNHHRVSSFLVFFLLVVSLILSACEDAATSNPGTALTPTGPSASTILIPTIATTKAGIELNLKDLKGLKSLNELVPDTLYSSQDEQKPGLAPAGLKVSLNIYSCDTEAESASLAVENAIKALGYRWGISEGNKVFLKDGIYLGIYSKPNEPDIISYVLKIDTALLDKLNTLRIGENTRQKTIEAVRNKISLVYILYGPGLISNLFYGAGPAPATATPAATTQIPSGWKTIDNKDSGFSIAMPLQVQKSETTAGTQRILSYTTPQPIDNKSYSTILTTFNQTDLTNGSPDNLVDLAVSAYTTKAKTIISRDTITFGQLKGIEVVAQQQDDTYIKIRTFLVSSNKSINLAVSGNNPDQFEDDDVLSFFDSFKLLS